ncbi:winged helix-turn-helix transcriptional regulator [Maricaulis sp.]|uniref:winged helix-turn-helix transcriptional regulator n=1 Tax=Maricaulis sp. TaxID=1486257 RepID=UPI003A902CCD
MPRTIAPRSSDTCRSHCPVNFVLETFGDKWTLLIIRDLMFKGKTTYGEFLQSAERIATNILANRLQRLAEHGIIEKAFLPTNRSVPHYALTQRGKDLLPVMIEITAWSARHDPVTNTPGSFLEAYERDRDALLTQLREQIHGTAPTD